MADTLKDRLNAKAQQANAKAAEQEVAAARYQETVLREYPRLLNSLLSRTHNILDGVTGLTFAEQRVPQALTHSVGTWSTDPRQHNLREVTVGTVNVPQWTISFLQRQISFRGAGIGFMGVHGKVDVITNAANPFPKDGIFMSAKHNSPDSWILVLADESPRRPSVVELTDDVLSEILEKYLVP